MLGPIAEQMVTHLEFLGYTIERLENSVRAKHPQHVNLVVQELKGGVLFTTLFGCTELAKLDRPKFLDAINTLNQKTVNLRFYASNDGALYIESWLPSLYDRASFGAFIELFLGNVALIGNTEIGVRKYLE